MGTDELLTANQVDDSLGDQSLSRQRRVYVAGAIREYYKQAGRATVVAEGNIRREEGGKSVGNLHIKGGSNLKENAIDGKKPLYFHGVVVIDSNVNGDQVRFLYVGLQVIQGVLHLGSAIGHMQRQARSPGLATDIGRV